MTNELREPPAHARLSSSIGDYLKTIWLLSRQVGDAVATGEIARELGVTAPSVTGMLGKMHGLGLVHYQPYRGAELTEAGRNEAVRLVRRHRLLETFMITELKFGWDEVHAEAELIEHVISDEFTERLAEHLGHPQFDPHGDPIPRADGSLPAAPHTPLTELKEGQVLEVHRVLSQDSDVLAYLVGLGVEPGAELRLRQREPGGHLLILERVVRMRGDTTSDATSDPASGPTNNTTGDTSGGHAQKPAAISLSREIASAVLGHIRRPTP